MVEACEKPRYQQSRMCSTHKMRMHRYGDLESRSRTGRVHADSGGYLVQGGVRIHRTVLLAKIGPGVHPCHWCSLLVSWDQTWPRHRDALVVDHVDADKQNNDPANLVPSCGRCNTSRMDNPNQRAAARRTFANLPPEQQQAIRERARTMAQQRWAKRRNAGLG